MNEGAGGRSHSLCPECNACPEVRMQEDGRVSIGEPGHVVRLEAEEWNQLVRLVRSGVLGEVTRA